MHRQHLHLSASIPPTAGSLSRRPESMAASRWVHCIAVDPRSPSGMSACWFTTPEEADAAFVRMSNSQSLASSTLERFKLAVPASATKDKIDELALAATQWESYVPIVCRAGERRAANDSGMAPLGSYELNWPHDADPEVGIRPRG